MTAQCRRVIMRGLLLTAGMAPPASASAADEESLIFLRLEAKTQAAWWNPGLASRGPTLVRYRTQGLATYRGEATVGYGGPMFTFGYERPFTPTTPQKDMLSVAERSDAGLEKFTFDLDFLPVLQYRFPILKENYLLRTLFSVEFRYSKSRFYGSAEVQRPFYYLPQDATVDLQARTVVGARKLSAGQRISFATTFTEQDISLSLWDFPNYAFRMGHFEVAWKRPSDNNHDYGIRDGASTLPILYETSYEANGISLRLQNRDPARAGLNGDVEMRIGLNNKIRATIAPQLQENESLAFFGLTGGVWYTWYLRKNRRGLFVSLGARADLRSWRVDVEDAEGKNEESKPLDAEKLVSGWASAGWKF